MTHYTTHSSAVSPVLPLCLQQVAQLSVEPALHVKCGHNVGVGLADQEVVDIEHLRQGAHGQVLFQAAVSPPPRSFFLSFWCVPAVATV